MAQVSCVMSCTRDRPVTCETSMRASSAGRPARASAVSASATRARVSGEMTGTDDTATDWQRRSGAQNNTGPADVARARERGCAVERRLLLGRVLDLVGRFLGGVSGFVCCNLGRVGRLVGRGLGGLLGLRQRARGGDLRVEAACDSSTLAASAALVTAVPALSSACLAASFDCSIALLAAWSVASSFLPQAARPSARVVATVIASSWVRIAILLIVMLPRLLVSACRMRPAMHSA